MFFSIYSNFIVNQRKDYFRAFFKHCLNYKTIKMSRFHCQNYQLVCMYIKTNCTYTLDKRNKYVKKLRKDNILNNIKAVNNDAISKTQRWKYFSREIRVNFLFSLEMDTKKKVVLLYLLLESVDRKLPCNFCEN